MAGVPSFPARPATAVPAPRRAPRPAPSRMNARRSMLLLPRGSAWRNVARLFEPLKLPAVHVIRSYDDQISEECQVLAARPIEHSLPTFRPLVAPRGLTEQLVARIAADITGGRLPPGSKLPTEKEMMAATGVSRTVVREAVACLRADGLVVVRQGVGAFVAEHVRRPFR